MKTSYKKFKKVKQEHYNEENLIVLIKTNGFYVTYKNDAVAVAEILRIMLTRGQWNEFFAKKSGFPCHCLDSYLPKLIRAGSELLYGNNLSKKLTRGAKASHKKQ